MNTLTLHQQAEDLREQDKLLEALKLYEEVIVNYQKEKNYGGIVEALGGRCLTYKHLFLISNDFIFYNLAQHSAISSLEIAGNYQLNHKIYRCYFRLGEMETLAKDYSQAIKFYQQSLSLYPQDDSEKGDFQYHLGEAQYLNGDIKNGLENLLKGLEKIRQYRHSTDSFLINVWESGCLMKLAMLTKDQKYLSAAKKIIDSDPHLIIRRRQLEQLMKS
jgi:tetratricopeptide (TPR) repeat protein